MNSHQPPPPPPPPPPHQQRPGIIPPPPTHRNTAPPLKKNRYDRSPNVAAARRREDLQQLKARIQSRLQPSTGTSVYTGGSGSVTGHAPVVNSSGSGSHHPPSQPPPVGRTVVPPAVLEVRSAIHGSEFRNRNAELKQRVAASLQARSRQRTAHVSATVSAIPGTPDTIARAERAIVEERPVDSKKGMIYLMNTYGKAADYLDKKNDSEGGEKLEKESVVDHVPSVVSVPAPMPPPSAPTTASKDMKTSKVQRPPVEVNVPNVNDTPSHDGVKADTSQNLKLPGMLHKEEIKRKELLEKVARKNKAEKNYKLFALLFAKVYKKKIEIVKLKSFMRLKDFRRAESSGIPRLNYISKHTSSVSSLTALEIPKFKLKLNEHTSKLASYSVRTADTPKEYEPEDDDLSYRTSFCTSNISSVSVRASLSADGSKLLLVNGNVFHSLDDGKTWKTNKDASGVIGYIDQIGNECQYNLDDVVSEMIAVRDAYTKSFEVSPNSKSDNEGTLLEVS